MYRNSWDRDFQFEAVSRAGHLIGLENVELGNRWRLKPYLLGGVGKSGTDGWDNRSEVGIDDFKIRVSSTLTADLTYNTDFAEVELDSQRANFSNPRNQHFFPEKREFFFEGASFFDFAARMNESQGNTFRAFFSRPIGLTSEGQRIPLFECEKCGRSSAPQAQPSCPIVCPGQPIESGKFPARGLLELAGTRRNQNINPLRREHHYLSVSFPKYDDVCGYRPRHKLMWAL